MFVCIIKLCFPLSLTLFCQSVLLTHCNFMCFLYDGEKGGGFLSVEVVVPGKLQSVVVQVHNDGLFGVFPPCIQVENVCQHSKQR